MNSIEQTPARARRLLHRYHKQVLDGCGSNKCRNQFCATFCGANQALSPDEAAAKALQLLKDGAKCCVKDSEEPSPSPPDLPSSSTNGAPGGLPNHASSSSLAENSNDGANQSQQVTSSGNGDVTTAEPTTRRHGLMENSDYMFTDAYRANTKTDEQSELGDVKPVEFLTEEKVLDLIKLCAESGDYGPLRRTIGEVFCSHEALMKSFLEKKQTPLSTLKEELESGLNFDMDRDRDSSEPPSNGCLQPGSSSSGTSQCKSAKKRPMKPVASTIDGDEEDGGNRENVPQNSPCKTRSRLEDPSPLDSSTRPAGCLLLGIEEDVESLLDQHSTHRITVDLASVRRTFDALFAIPDQPFVHSLSSAMICLCDNALLDIKFQNIYDKEPLYLNIFVILMEVPAVEASSSLENFSKVFGTLVKALAELPIDAHMRLAQFWSRDIAKTDLLIASGEMLNLNQSSVVDDVSSSYDPEVFGAPGTARPSATVSPPKSPAPHHLLAKVHALQHLITMTIATQTFSQHSPIQDDSVITSAARVLRIIYYASVYSGAMAERREAAVLGTNVDDLSTAKDVYSDALGSALGLTAADIRQTVVPFEEFYNEVLCESIEMEVDYLHYRHDGYDRFSFMKSTPFLLNPGCKVQGLWYDSRIRMYSQRREAVMNLLFEGTPHQPYLKIKVRRDRLIEDALLELEFLAAEAPNDLKKQLYVEFDGEAGVDEGGLSKEFYQLVTQQLFNADYGMWIFHPESQLYWFSPQQVVPEQEYTLVGILFGLAIYNSIIFDVKFPMVLYRKLMGKRGVLSDLADIDPTLHRSLYDLLAYEGDVEDTFCLSFQITYTDVFGSAQQHDLKPNGTEVPVTKHNRREFVALYADFLLNESVKDQFDAFYKGFDMVTSESPLIWTFRPEELEQSVCGSPHYDFNALESVTVYDNELSADHQLVKWFWEVVHGMTEEEHRLLLQFCTGSDRVPVGGLANMKFIIAKNGPDSDRLPTAHTCFNVLLVPEYCSKEKLRDRLLKAIFNSQGFGLM